MTNEWSLQCRAFSRAVNYEVIVPGSPPFPIGVGEGVQWYSNEFQFRVQKS